MGLATFPFRKGRGASDHQYAAQEAKRSLFHCADKKGSFAEVLTCFAAGQGWFSG